MKCVALIAMLIDHMNDILLSPSSLLLYAVGRMAMPLFALIFAFNMAKQPGRAQELAKRQWKWAIITQPFFAFAFYGHQPWYALNILFVFAVCSQLVAWVYPRTQDCWIKSILLIAIFAWPLSLASYGLVGIVFEQLNIQPDFLMEINDFYMEKKDGNEIDGANQYRKKATSPYIIPERINSYIKDINKCYGIDIRSFYFSEKTMADRFKRHIKNTVDKNLLFNRQERNLLMTVDEHTFAIIENNKPTCAAGNAATFRAIRYKVSSNKIFDNYTSHIGVFPLCSRINVLNGYRAASAFYDGLSLPSLLVFFGKSCFE